MADQAKGKGIAPKMASNPADPGQSSRPLPPIRTLSEDKEDGKDYSEVIEVLKHVNAIKNISSTLASLTNSSNAATTGKTSYSPRFDPFSSTMDLHSPLCPPRKEPYLGPAVNSVTSNLDPPIDTGSKEGFKDTITSSIVKELSKKAYTIPDNRISNFLENPDISNTYSDSNQAVLLMLLCNSLSSGPRAAILWIYIPSKAFKLLVRQYSRPIKSKKEDVYNEFHALTFSTYKKGLSAFNAEFNGYLAKLTMAKIDIDPSLILNYLNIEYLMADILEESRNPAIEAYRAAYIANSSNSTPNSNSNPSKKGKNKKKGKKKASYNIEGQNYSAKSAEQASFMLGSYNLAIEEEEESDSSSNSSQLRPINTGNGPISPASIGSITLEVLSRKAPPTYTKLVLDNVLYLPNIDINIVSRVRHYDLGGCLIKEPLYRGNRRCIAILDFKKSGFFLDVKGSSKPILHANFAFPLGLSSYTTKSIELQRNKIVVEIPSNSIRKEDYRPIIEDAIVSEAIEPNKRYKLRNSPAKGTTLEGVGPSLRGKRPYRPTREPKPLTGTRDLPYVLREPVIEGNKVEKAISSPTLKEPNIERYRAIGARGEAIIPLEKRSKSLKFTSRTEECKLLAVLGSKTYLVYIPSRRAVLETSTVKFIEDNTVLSQPTNNTALKGESVDLDLDLEGAVSLDPSNLNTEKPISIEIGPSKLEPYKSSSDKPIFAPKPIEVIVPNQPITNEPLNNSNLISEGDKMQLDYYKLLAKTSSYILILPTWHILLAIGAVLDWEIEQADFIGVFLNSSLREEIYMEIPEGLLDLAASNKAIYKLLLKYGYNPSTPYIIKLSKALYNLGVFYNAKTCHFIVTYIDDCLFIGPNIGYITDLKKRLNKVYTIEDLGPAAYFLGVQIIRDRPNRRL
ncbi:hypothetical protein P8C59_004292 [Phyllachora maydis]|uniref:Reverse transcriptase Ty1/copia-type domain-containing protein n=1 Tax=Phyllachora maydis TaxID=1825666 RepID=A0AAD9MDB7_9PEZI|nr:hypothetical protein P8C59_004292 [Phyllachora maydis]